MTKNDLTWKEEYTLGDKYIDSQHQEFFNIAQQAHALQNIDTEDEKKKALRKIMNDLFKYINYHFECEETYMNKVNYPLVEEHLKLHNNMKDQLNFINFNLLTINIDKAQEKLFHFIQKIFVDHILEEDLKVVEFTKRK